MQMVRHSLELIIWLWIQPSSWLRYINNIDSTIPANFALLDLNWSHLQINSLRSLLISGYIIIPLCVLAIALPLALSIFGDLHGSAIGYLYVYVLGLCIGLYISVPASILFLLIAGFFTPFQWAGSEALMFDFSSGHSAGLLFSCCSACTIVAGINHGDTRRSQSIARQSGAIILGLLISLPIVVGVVLLVLATSTGRQSGTLHGGWIIWTMLLPPLLLSIVTALIKTGSVLKTLLPAVFCLVLFSAGFGDMGYEYDRSVGGFALLSPIMTVVIATFCMLSIFPNVLVRPFVGDLPACITGAVGGLAIHFGLQASFTYYPLIVNLTISIAIILSAVLFKQTWSLLSYPFEAAWNRLTVELDSRPAAIKSSFHRHSLFWDEIQFMPFFELDDHLVEMSEKNKIQGSEHIEAVNRTNQRWAAQAALTELDARRLESLPDIVALADADIDENAGLFPATAGLILRSFSRFSSDISVALEQPSSYNRVLVLRTVVKDLELLHLELQRNFQDKFARRFTAVTEHWRKIVLDQAELIESAARASKEIPNPYTVGVPLTRRQSIFVGRNDIARFLEDIFKQQDHPPLLLHGARRMGKTSLLYQLHWMLPQHILTLIVDLQGPVGLAQDHQGFVFALARTMRIAAEKVDVQLSQLPRESITENPFLDFDEWLNTIEAEMQGHGRDTILLALDEFEALDTTFSETSLNGHSILGMLRHMGQHRKNLKLMLVGSHTLDEFHKWSSYLVNAQVVELTYLSEPECHQLIENPVADFPLNYKAEAVARIISFTRGHPYLIQLSCAELVALKNQQPEDQRLCATPQDVEKCIPLILERGQQFFRDMQLNQIDDHGLRCLVELCSMGEAGATANMLESRLTGLKQTDTLEKLMRRGIIELKDDHYQFQIEAVAQWFRSMSH